MYIVKIFLLIIFISCQPEVRVEEPLAETQNDHECPVSDNPPLAINSTPANASVNVESSITLNYTDKDSDKATACSASSLSNITISSPCSCDGAGLCTIGVTGTLNYDGAVSAVTLYEERGHFYLRA